MSYPGVLLAVARLHVDLAFRDAFLRDPSAALAAMDLGEAEREALSTIEPRTVTLLGRIADHHRRMRLIDYLPWVDVTLRPGLAPLLEHYMRSEAPELLSREEALSFCRFLRRLPVSDPPYLAELARYEELRLSIAWSLHGDCSEVTAVPFAYAIAEVATQLAAPGWPAAEPRPTRLSIKKVPAIPAVIVRPAP